MSSRAVTTLALAALLTAASVQAQQESLPRRKSGLWDMVAELQHRPGQAVRMPQCVDAGTDDALQQRALAGDDRTACSVQAIRRIGGGVEVESTCKNPEGGSTRRARVVGDMSSSYRIESQIRYDTPQAGVRDTRLVVRGTYMGACPPGVKPGERVQATATPAPPPAGIDATAPARLDAMTPLERHRALQQMGKAEKH